MGFNILKNLINRKKKLYIMCGPPASGKTSFVKNRIRIKPGIHISRDEIRYSLLKDNENYFSHEKTVFQIYVSKIQEALDNPRGPEDVYADATQINRKSRKKLLDALDLTNVDTIFIIVMSVSFLTLIERNNKRDGKAKVPEDAIKRMLRSQDIPNAYEYNFPKIIVWYVDERGKITGVVTE